MKPVATDSATGRPLVAVSANNLHDPKPQPGLPAPTMFRTSDADALHHAHTWLGQALAEIGHTSNRR